MSLTEYNQEVCQKVNTEVLSRYGWRTYCDRAGKVWYSSEEHWSRQFPLFAIMSDNLKEKLLKTIDEHDDHGASKATPSPSGSPRQPSPEPPPAGSLPSGIPPPPPVPPPQALALVSPFLMMSSSMVPIQNDCSWHATKSWTGQEWPTAHQGYVADENAVTSGEHLEGKLQSLRDCLFWDGMQGWEFFDSVVTQRFRAGHIHVKFMATGAKHCGIELACARCCRWSCISVNTKWITPKAKDEARATLLSYISGCEYYVPGSRALRQS